MPCERARRFGEGENRDKSVGVQDEAPSGASNEAKPSPTCVLRRLIELSTMSHGSTPSKASAWIGSPLRVGHRPVKSFLSIWRCFIIDSDCIPR
jgi:hypothetical protein